MGFFKKKKKPEEEEQKLPPLKFPEFPERVDSKASEAGINLAEAAKIKEAIDPGLDIPIRKPKVKPVGYDELELKEDLKEEEDPEPEVVEEDHEPEVVEEEPFKYKEGKTLFIQVENYNNAMRVMEDVKGKIKDIETIMGKLENIKNDEDKELEKWRNDLESIKNKILNIDKTLFE